MALNVILSGHEGFWAIEVKNAMKIHPSHARPLTSFKENYPESEAILLHRLKERLRFGEVLCPPCAEFLRSLRRSENRIDAAFC